ncbi:hypothetical protein [Sorangium sp. So ce128]|uniref:hypothetical protein n=1 Tax=Sorangium sp. So ce128 TaxID=3133281 RepID=UPI003F63D55E
MRFARSWKASLYQQFIHASKGPLPRRSQPAGHPRAANLGALLTALIGSRVEFIAISQP